MKERRERTMGDFVTDVPVNTDPLDYVISERFEMERHPEASVDGDSPWERDPFEGEPIDPWRIVGGG